MTRKREREMASCIVMDAGEQGQLRPGSCMSLGMRGKGRLDRAVRSVAGRYHSFQFAAWRFGLGFDYGVALQECP